eukprot:6505733-Pyramimonas_sp.AAC.1
MGVTKALQNCPATMCLTEIAERSRVGSDWNIVTCIGKNIRAGPRGRDSRQRRRQDASWRHSPWTFRSRSR